MSQPSADISSYEQRIADYREQLRREYEESGSSLSIDQWQEERRLEDKRRRDEERDAEILAERKVVRIRVLDKQTPARYLEAAAEDPGVVAWAAQVVKEQHETWEERPSRRVIDGWAPEPKAQPASLRGPSLLLLGPTGVGKTHQAFGALKRIAQDGCHTSLKVTTAADFYAQLRPRHGVDTEEVFERFAWTSVLFLDDLGAAKTSEWVEEINYRLVNHRYNHQLATLLTSNVPPKQLGEQLGDRVASRLTEMCTIVALKGADRRRAS